MIIAYSRKSQVTRGHTPDLAHYRRIHIVEIRYQYSMWITTAREITQVARIVKIHVFRRFVSYCIIRGAQLVQLNP